MNEKIVLIDESGAELEFEIEAFLEVEGDKYAILIPLNIENSEDAVIMRFDVDDNGEDLLMDIDDDEEWEKVAAAYDTFAENEYGDV